MTFDPKAIALIETMIGNAINADLTAEERKRRLDNIESALGILKQMRKLPSTGGMSAMNEIHTLRTIVKDAAGIRGEEM